MPQQILTDSQLLEVYKNPQADLSLLTPEEQNRLVKLTEPSTQAAAPPAAPATQPSFFDNVINSGAKAVGGIIDGGKMMGHAASSYTRMMAGNPQPMIEDAKAVVPILSHPVEVGSALWDAMKNRYGSLSKIGKTLYEDPIGAALDVSTVAGGAGLAAKAGGLSKTAKLLGTVEKFTNPMTLAGKAAQGLAREAGIGTTLATVRPSADLAEDFGGRRKIASTIVDNGLTSHKSVQAPLDAGKKAVDDLLASIDAQRPNVRGALPPARESVPLGNTPVPQGGQASVTRPDIIMNPVQQPAVPGPSRANLDGLVGTRTALGGAAPALPVQRLGFDDEAIRLAESVGEQSRLSPTGPLLGEGRPVRTVFEPQFLGTPEGNAIGDTIGGPGVMFRENPTLGGPGRVLKGQERGVHIDDLVASIMGEPGGMATRRAKLGDADLRPALQARIEALKTSFPTGEIPLPEANALKREAQTLAYESGKDNLSVQKAAQQAEARALRAGIEEKVPAVGPMNQREQDLLGASYAFKQAGRRDPNLQHLLSILAGTGLGFSTGHVGEGLATAGIGLALNSPTFGPRVAKGLTTVGNGLGSSEAAKAALILRLAQARANQ